MTEPEVYLPSLRAYWQQQLVEMRANEDKPTWIGLSADEMLLDLYYHTSKLHYSLWREGPEKVREYAADVGNLAMMVAECAGALTPVRRDSSSNDNALPIAIALRDGFKELAQRISRRKPYAAELQGLMLLVQDLESMTNG